MSLIFEALEKVEQEKKGEGKKPLSEKPPGALPPAPKLVSSPKEKTNPVEAERTIYGLGGALLFLFVLGLIYLLASSQPSTKSEQVTPISPVSSAPARGRMFSLTGITQVGPDRTAIINNQFVRVGERVSGAEVKQIEDREAVLEYQGQTVRLSLD